jgi:hypothetical protein
MGDTSPPVRILLDVPLTFEVPEEGGATRTIHTPMVHATIGGQPTLLIVDTGASDTVLTRELVSSWSGELVEGEPGTDHAGAPVRSWELVGEVGMSIGEWTTSLSAPIVIDGPPPFEQWGIGGFVSPQTLHDTATVVVDLRGLRIQLVEGERELIRAGVEKSLGTPAIHVPRHLGEGDAQRLVIVGASVGGVSVPLMINTGGSDAELSPSVATSGSAGAGQELGVVGRGVSGVEVMGSTQHNIRIEVSGQLLHLDEVTLRDQGESYAGQLGIAELLGSVLLIEPFPDGALVWWR